MEGQASRTCGRWPIAAQRLAPFGTVWTWVPREQNKHADRLANLAMDAAARGEIYTPDGSYAESRDGSGVPRR